MFDFTHLKQLFNHFYTHVFGCGLVCNMIAPVAKAPYRFSPSKGFGRGKLLHLHLFSIMLKI